ncbi:restriction endonuclease subunit S [Vibrio furnissii]|uniref:restriction endonuclease subunit S n=1 Tax=Vibrio furnissii TaxID=29494 RepID=UPI001EEBA168|nr:restriction endonuclease subunit S [Vibrio furnissii]MCG6231518.1 restriction endonuclease subunit S [Vibrio furnissii]MCG6261443.1 restriction endonuclease subunit S [Vibrio furnissii]
MLSGHCESMFAGAPASFFNKDVSNAEQTFKALRGTDLLEDGYIAAENLDDVEVKEGKNISKFVLREGDVVLLARGQSMRSCIVTKEVAEQRLIATANFIVLRLKSGQRGEFLVAYLNSAIGKQVLTGLSSSTSVIKSIALSGLKKLDIRFPPVEKQKQIADLFHANVAAQRAAQTLMDEQNKTVEVKILNWLQEA